MTGPFNIRLMNSTMMNATQARSQFFELLNRVLYGGETVYISKAGAKDVVEIKRVAKPKTLKDFTGIISEEDARLMKEAIAEARSRPNQPAPSFD